MPKARFPYSALLRNHSRTRSLEYAAAMSSASISAANGEPCPRTRVCCARRSVIVPGRGAIVPPSTARPPAAAPAGAHPCAKDQPPSHAQRQDDRRRPSAGGGSPPMAAQTYHLCDGSHAVILLLKASAIIPRLGIAMAREASPSCRGGQLGMNPPRQRGARAG